MTSHVDTFVLDHLPPKSEWPELRYDLPELQFDGAANCAVDVLDQRVAEGHGARVAVLDSYTEWTYDDLREHSNQIGQFLRTELGVVPGNRVLLFGPNTGRLAACWFGIVKAGGVVVAAMPMLRARELATLIERAQISHAICDSRVAETLLEAQQLAPALQRIRTFRAEGEDGFEAAVANLDGETPAVATALDDPALIAFTSGTTGIPKATVHTHRDVMAACRCWPRHVLRPTPDDRVIGSPPLAFTFGLGGLLLFPLSAAASAVLVEKASPDALPDLVTEFGATVMVTAPTAYRAMLQQRGRALRGLGLRKCVSAGEALPAATRDAWREATGVEIIDGIGATELLHIFISHTETEARSGATGKVVPGYEARVVDDRLQPVPPGTVGRLAVRGPTGCRYLDDPRQRDYVRDGWNFPGDAYAMDEDGYFHHHGRTDDLIVTGGYNIAGPEVESALLQHPAVAECGVVGLPDETRGQIVAAFVVAAAGVTADEGLAAQLQQHVKATIAPYKYPRRITFVAALPRTSTGKLQRFRLRQLPAGGTTR